ncbi:hypothetical protein N0V88_001589 [Collariella sp. IMI 366227]|nr:hypothetical protein N0V88_001589 [Collariella sp. IMI 366227]
MGRWSHLDTDEERLPDGMTRIGYDADTQVYTYRDSDGSYWEGAPGVQYGKLHRVRDATPPLPSAFIPDNVEGEEPGYVLHDKDDEDDFDLDSSSDEKKPGSTTTPTRLRARPSPDLPDDADKMSGTTVTVGYPYSETAGETQPHNGNNSTSLKRSGTLSRIARFLSGGSSSSSSSTTTHPRPRRRATVASRSDAAARFGHGHHHEKRDAKEGKTATTTVTGDRWPGQASNPPPMRKRATTFDEILGSM